MGISSRNPGLYIGFPSSYISRYFTSVKFKFPLVASIFTSWLCMKCVSEIGVLITFQRWDVDWLCMKRVSGIGVLISCI